MDALRSRATASSSGGQLLPVPPADVAFLASTARGPDVAIKSIDWRPGGNIVFADTEFPTTGFAAVNLSRHGVQPRLVPSADARHCGASGVVRGYRTRRAGVHRRTLEVLVAAGPIRGLRFASMISPNRGWFERSIEPLAAVAARRCLTVNLLCSPAWLTAADEWIERNPELSIVVDHLGRPDPAADLPQESACDDLLRLARHDHVHVKLTALPELSSQGYAHRDVWPWVRATVRAFGPTSRSRWTRRQPTGS